MNIAIYGTPMDFDRLWDETNELNRDNIVTTHISPEFLHEALEWADIIVVCKEYDKVNKISEKVKGSRQRLIILERGQKIIPIINTPQPPSKEPEP